MGNILVADDSLAQLAIIEHFLLGGGHCIHKANNGLKAIKIIEENNIDILIADIFMPGIDGIELIMRAKRLKTNIGIIAISGGGNLIKGYRYLDYVKQLGADFSFKKPLGKQDVLDAVEYILLG